MIARQLRKTTPHGLRSALAGELAAARDRLAVMRG